MLRVAWVGNTVDAGACIAFRNFEKENGARSLCPLDIKKYDDVTKFRRNTSLFCDANVIISTKRTQRSTYLTVVERSMYGVGVQREILLDDNVDYKVRRQVQHSW